jgi:ankyrin repeat protein
MLSEHYQLMCAACCSGDISTVRDCVHVYGADTVKAARPNGSSLLYHACENGRHDMAAYLLDLGCDIEDGMGLWTPLLAAIREKQTDVVALLLERGASLSAKSPDGDDAQRLSQSFSDDTIAHMVEEEFYRRHGQDITRDMLTRGLPEPAPAVPRITLRKNMAKRAPR